MARILVIEDDAVTGGEISRELHGQGHDVTLVGDGAAAEQALMVSAPAPFDAITLDRMLPDRDGLTIVAWLRERGIDTPVLMISALGDVDARIAGLRAGGDDYMVKPFAPDEMAMRIEVLLRRTATAAATVLRVGALEIDLISRTVTVDGVAVKLLPMEFRLLAFLARNPGRPVSRRILFEQVWNYHFDPGANLINVHIGRLRRKIDRPGYPSAIVTLKGEGYRLDAV